MNGTRGAEIAVLVVVVVNNDLIAAAAVVVKVLVDGTNNTQSVGCFSRVNGCVPSSSRAEERTGVMVFLSIVRNIDSYGAQSKPGLVPYYGT